MRTTNIDTLSAYIDRLITERIKHYFFEKDSKEDLVKHQENVIKEIKLKLNELFIECFSDEEYEYLSERRTFTLQGLITEIDSLVVNDLNIGHGDRVRLGEIQKDNPNLTTIIENEKLTRISNEGRANNKNSIDKMFEDLWP